MSKSKKALLSVGAAIATKKLAGLFSDFEFDDLLRPMGLARRRSHWGETILTLGVGIVIGGGAALLLAPSNGKETRARLADKMNALAETALPKVEESVVGAATGFDMQGARVNFAGAHVSI